MGGRYVSALLTGFFFWIFQPLKAAICWSVLHRYRNMSHRRRHFWWKDELSRKSGCCWKLVNGAFLLSIEILLTFKSPMKILWFLGFGTDKAGVSLTVWWFDALQSPSCVSCMSNVLQLLCPFLYRNCRSNNGQTKLQWNLVGMVKWKLILLCFAASWAASAYAVAMSQQRIVKGWKNSLADYSKCCDRFYWKLLCFSFN